MHCLHSKPLRKPHKAVTLSGKNLMATRWQTRVWDFHPTKKPRSNAFRGTVDFTREESLPLTDSRIPRAWKILHGPAARAKKTPEA